MGKSSAYRQGLPGHFTRTPLLAPRISNQPECDSTRFHKRICPKTTVFAKRTPKFGCPPYSLPHAPSCSKKRNNIRRFFCRSCTLSVAQTRMTSKSPLWVKPESETVRSQSVFMLDNLSTFDGEEQRLPAGTAGPLYPNPTAGAQNFKSAGVR